MPEIYNFAPGPATLPPEVLKRAQQELLNWRNTEVSIMEIGHRTDVFQQLVDEVKHKIRTYLAVPDNYQLLFMHGGAQSQFSFIPMNLTLQKHEVDYLSSGMWSERAITYAKRYAKVNVVAQADVQAIPEQSTWQLNPNAAYMYYCANESVSGMRMPYVPNVTNVPLVVDVSSSIMSEVIDVSKFGLIFASAQKNLGIAGITLIIIRDDLLDQALDITPEIFNYSIQLQHNSLLNTVSTVAIYMMDLMLDWLQMQGSLADVAASCFNKANKVYQCIDAYPHLYRTKISKPYRSYTNISFNLANPELLTQFLAQADTLNLKYLRGHKAVGGVRASLYNAMPEVGVDKLVKFMHDFAQQS